MLRLLLVLAALILAAPASAQQAAEAVDTRIDTVLGNHVPYEAAYVDLKAALEANDQDALAALFPIGGGFRLNGTEVNFATADEAKAKLGEMLTDKVKEAVLAQAYEALFVNADGVMFGTGQVWLGGICKDEACKDFDVRIIAINNSPAP
ncbi:MAG: hypothetical protein ABL879_17335 [Devosia sp.]